MNYIVEGEVVDTYGGDFTWRDVWYEVEEDEEEIAELMVVIKGGE